LGGKSLELEGCEVSNIAAGATREGGGGYNKKGGEVEENYTQHAKDPGVDQARDSQGIRASECSDVTSALGPTSQDSVCQIRGGKSIEK